MAKLKFTPDGYQDLGAYALLKNVVENGNLIAEDSNACDVCLLESITCNGTQTYVDFTLPPGYNTFKIELTGIMPSTNGYIQLLINDGNSWLSTYYNNLCDPVSNTSYTDTLSSLFLSLDPISINPSRVANGDIIIQNPKQTGLVRRTIKSSISYFDDTIVPPATENTYNFKINENFGWTEECSSLITVRILVYDSPALPSDGYLINSNSNFRLYGIK